jgi:hypothetical protein
MARYENISKSKEFEVGFKKLEKQFKHDKHHCVKHKYYSLIHCVCRQCMDELIREIDKKIDNKTLLTNYIYIFPETKYFYTGITSNFKSRTYTHKNCYNWVKNNNNSIQHVHKDNLYSHAIINNIEFPQPIQIGGYKKPHIAAKMEKDICMEYIQKGYKTFNDIRFLGMHKLVNITKLK